jgi:acetolactate synthase-1/3 small subunit/acetolactate synthase II small subunit
MRRTIELRLARAEGAIVRTLGLIERRGFAVTAITMRSDGASETLVLRLEVVSEGRPFDVLLRQIMRLFDVRAALLVESPHGDARAAC